MGPLDNNVLTLEGRPLTHLVRSRRHVGAICLGAAILLGCGTRADSVSRGTASEATAILSEAVETIESGGYRLHVAVSDQAGETPLNVSYAIDVDTPTRYLVSRVSDAGEISTDERLLVLDEEVWTSDDGGKRWTTLGEGKGLDAALSTIGPQAFASVLRKPCEVAITESGARVLGRSAAGECPGEIEVVVTLRSGEFWEIKWLDRSASVQLVAEVDQAGYQPIDQAVDHVRSSQDAEVRSGQDAEGKQQYE